MANPICPEHGLEAVAKTAVPNKNTGGFYPPFFGCPYSAYDPAQGKKVYCKHRFTEKPSPTAMASGIQTTAVASAMSKDTQIKYMNALNCAATLLAPGMEDAQEKLNRMKVFADTIFLMTAPDPAANEPPF